jgi:hypothetical protein
MPRLWDRERLGGNSGRFAVAGAALAAAALWPAPASAETVLDETVSAANAVDRTCFAEPLEGADGVATRPLPSPGLGYLQVSLSAPAGDWDLAVLDAKRGSVVAASAYSGASEVASGFVFADDELLVQACRRSGDASSADLEAAFTRIEPGVAETASLVRVATPTPESVTELQSLGIDLTEHSGPGYVGAVLHGTEDAKTLTTNGFTYTVDVKDLAATSASDRETERSYAKAARGGGSSLPSGNTTYRRLFEYSEEMKELEQKYPKLVKSFTLPNETYEGRPVEGIEVAARVRRSDGRPSFAIMGVHHAREWPSGEHTMEWAYELIEGYRDGKRKYRRLMRRTRTLVVPIVNPDGFNTSREAGELQGAGNGRGGSPEEANIVAHPNEYRRKNCRFSDDSDGGSCLQPSFGVEEPGVDPNRNYGGLWGGPGASPPPMVTASDYRGPAPFSEPETQNIRHMVSRHQVTTLITNHTFSNLVLHPPGLAESPTPPDDRALEALSDRMAEENGYTSQRGYELYDTSGTTEDWSYNATGGFGYTFEIGPDNFHPPFPDVIAEYNGTTAAAGQGGGNRAAYLVAQRNTMKRKQHSVIAGKAPRGSYLELRKRFRTKTSPVIDATGEPGEVIRFKERLRDSLRVRRSGQFRWHVNPSTRPAVAGEPKGPRPRPGRPSDPVAFSGAAGPSASPCADTDTTDETCWNDHPFEVEGGDGVDNGIANIRAQWTTVTSDWDMKVFRDSDGDGSSEGETNQVASSLGIGGTTDSESATLTRPTLKPGDYVIRMINYAAAEPYEGRVNFSKTPERSAAGGKVERWTVLCRESKGSPVLERTRIRVDRGDVAKVNLSGACR